MTSEPGMTVEDVTVEREGYRVLTDVTFEVGPGTLMGVVGPNGAGKSTLFDAVAGLLLITRGKILLHGADARKGALAYVPQRDSINWSFPVTVWDVVAMGRFRSARWFRPLRKQDREMVRACLCRVGLWERRSSLMTELSGGQRQRAFIARALAQEASIVLLDEAFSGVDVGAQEGIVGVLQSLRDEGGSSCSPHMILRTWRSDSIRSCASTGTSAPAGRPRRRSRRRCSEELYGSHGIEFSHDGGERRE